MISNSLTICVGIPAHNEEKNIGRLVKALLSDPHLAELLVADDVSTDQTRQIVERISMSDSRVRLLPASVRGGQIARWLDIAKSTEADILVFIDADSMPDPGSVGTLANACASAIIASGRVCPIMGAGGNAGHFSAEMLHWIRNGTAKVPAVIGRFFAVRRAWFLEACARTDIVANDAYLACLALRGGKLVQYVPDATVRYVTPADGIDFAAQRQRADAGIRQLREMGLLVSGDLPNALALVRAIIFASISSPRNLPSWLRSQILSKLKRVYKVPAGAHTGIWETQASTKEGL